MSLAAAARNWLVSTFPELLKPSGRPPVLFCGVKIRQFAARLAFECSLPVYGAEPLPRSLAQTQSHLAVEDLWADLGFRPSLMEYAPTYTEELEKFTKLTKSEEGEEDSAHFLANWSYILATRYGLVTPGGLLSEI